MESQNLEELHESSLKDQLVSECEQSLRKLRQIWNHMGCDKAIINKYENDVFQHFRELFRDMVTEAEEKLNDVRRSAQKMIDKIDILCQELKMETSLPDIKREPLLKADAILKKKLKELELIKENRLTEVRELLEQECHVCKLLGLQTKGFDCTVPSHEEIRDFAKYISTKEADLAAYKITFKELRRSIVKMMAEMAYTPTLNFEKLVYQDHHNFIFSQSNMEKLEQLHDHLKEQLDSMKDQAERKREELQMLWLYLDMPRDQCREFLEKYSGFDTVTLNALNKEIRRCKEIRKENMAKFIGKVREEIKHWWDICKFGPEERNSFHLYTSDVYSEDMLKLHEIEVERLRKYYEDNQELYELFDKREEMWDQMKEANRQSENPDRLNNRGGQLLEEEKKRKYLNKNFPKIEKQLAEVIQQYEQKYNKQFTIFGLKLSEYFEQQLEEHKEEIEKLKVEKQKRSAKKTPLSASRRHLTTISLRTANTSLKRKASPLNRPNKNIRLANSENLRPNLVNASKMRRSAQKHKVVRKLLSSSKRQSKSPKPSKKNKSNVIEINDTVDSTRTVQQYEEFQEHLAQRDELRSTLLLDVKDVNRAHRPVRTPSKPLRKSPSTVTPLRKNKVVSRLKSPIIASTPKFAAAPMKIKNNF